MLQLQIADTAFCPETLVTPGVQSGRPSVSRTSSDPITILTVMGMATERLGLCATFSTTYFEPFREFARVFANLDLATDGRAAWNIVTSMNDGEWR